jgi:uncharacterized protein (TIGR02001 family)
MRWRGPDVRAAAAPARQRRIAAGALAFSLALPGAAHAQWSGSASAESDYRFRGVSLSSGKPSLRLAVNYDAPRGWYAGASATQSLVTPGDLYAQLLGYAGYVTPLAQAALDIGLTASTFVGERRYDFGEAYAGLLFRSGALRLSYSPDYFGRHVQTLYLDASGQLPLAGNWRLLAHAGVLVPLTTLAIRLPEVNHARADLRAGLGWTRREVDLTLAWSAASRGGPPPASAAQRRGGWLVTAAWFF